MVNHIALERRDRRNRTASPMAASGPEGAVAITRDGPVLRLVIDRPSHRNSLNHNMIDEFVAALTDAAIDDTLRAVHITGAGENFCSGADWVSTNAAGDRPRTGDLVRRIPLTSHRIVELIQTIALPVVCSVRGWAVGLGCNLALAADFTVVADDAVFWHPFINRGFSPDSGASWLLPRLVGLVRARQGCCYSARRSPVRSPQSGVWCTRPSNPFRSTPPPKICSTSWPAVRRWRWAWPNRAWLSVSMQHWYRP